MNDISTAFKGTEKTTEILNNGLSQVFEYGVAMTILSLCLIVSLLLSFWLLRNFMRFIKDSQKILADTYALLGVIKVELDNIHNQYNQILIILSKSKGD